MRDRDLGASERFRGRVAVCFFAHMSGLHAAGMHKIDLSQKSGLEKRVGGDNRPTMQNWLLAETPDLARGFRAVLLFFSWVSYRLARSAQPAITDSSVAAADWNSFGQSIGPPGAALGAKATPAAEIATRVTESFGRTNGYVSQPRATSPATSAIFYTPLEREEIGRLWRLCIK